MQGDNKPSQRERPFFFFFHFEMKGSTFICPWCYSLHLLDAPCTDTRLHDTTGSVSRSRMWALVLLASCSAYIRIQIYASVNSAACITHKCIWVYNFMEVIIHQDPHFCVYSFSSEPQTQQKCHVTRQGKHKQVWWCVWVPLEPFGVALRSAVSIYCSTGQLMQVEYYYSLLDQRSAVFVANLLKLLR